MGIASPDDQIALALLASRIEGIEICTATIEGGGRLYATTATSGYKLFAPPRYIQSLNARVFAHHALTEWQLTYQRNLRDLEPMPLIYG